jgi:hypothetical protein
MVDISDIFLLYYWISDISLYISLLYLHSHFVPKIIQIRSRLLLIIFLVHVPDEVRV